MRKKDVIALGILEGHFNNEQQARQYCEHHGLKVEFKSMSSKGAFLMKISNREGWISPKSWVDNHLSELRRQFGELSDRLGNLGEPTSGPTSVETTIDKPLCLFLPVPGERPTANGIARSFLNGLRMSGLDRRVEVVDSSHIYSECDSVEDGSLERILVDAIMSLGK